MKIIQADYGLTNNGENVQIYHLENASGAYVEIIDYGCRVVKIVVPDREGHLTDVCVGVDSLTDFEKDTCFFGATVGRYANRIKDGRFTLNGKEYTLATNDGPNHLHGGIKGYGCKVWKSAIQEDKVVFTMYSPDGEEGYPGNLTLTASFSWSEDNELSIVYEASTDQDTILNVTNHAYYNLSGEGNGNVLSHELFIDADAITEVDDTQAPTGQMIAVEGSPFDFRNMHTVGQMINSEYPQLHNFGTYDHNFVINGMGLREAAVLQSKESGIRMTCFTDQPGMQLYVSPKVLEINGKGGKPYGAYSSLCLETQHFPDSINHENFPSVVLRPEESFRSKTLYHFSTF